MRLVFPGVVGRDGQRRVPPWIRGIFLTDRETLLGRGSRGPY